MQSSKRVSLSLILTALLLASAISTAKQSVTPINEAQAREWAAYAAEKAAGDQKAFDERFKSLARILAQSYRADPFSLGATIYTSDALDIVAVGPVSDFQQAASEAVRKMTPIDKMPWPCGASIYVFPSRIDSPDIGKMVVRRGGAIVEPIGNTLVSKPMTTRAGVTVALHSGAVCYTTATFAPGAEVTVIAIPVTGTNITKTLNDADLKVIV